MAKQTWQNKYKDKCGAMIIDPFFVGDYLENYPILNEINCSVGDVRYNDFVKATAFVLDPNSPFVKTYPDLNARRKAVYDELGYMGYEDKVFEVLLLLRLYMNHEWTLYCAEQNVFYELIVRANKPVEFEGMDEKKQLDAVVVKDKLMDTLDKLIDRLDNRFKKMFMNDTELMEVGKAEMSVRRPEDYANKNRRQNAIPD